MATRIVVPLAVVLSVVPPAPVPHSEVAAQQGPPGVRELDVEVDRATQRFNVTLPDRFDRARWYPVALDHGDHIDAAALRERGWIRVSPGRGGFAAGGAWVAPVLRKVRTQFRVAGNRVHLVGDRSALAVLAQEPQEFGSAIIAWDTETAPELPAAWLTAAVRLRPAAGGGLDVAALRRVAARLASPAIDARATDEGIVAALEDLRQRAAPAGTEAQRTIDALLDDFHDAAAKADAARYFACLAPQAVFLGTDASERWPRSEFEAFARPHFQRDSAWIFVPQERHVDVAPAGGFAWFDEELGSHSYGRCRGSGALLEIGGRWRITQYNLTIPIPNDLARELVPRIKAFESQPASRPAAARPAGR